ncbi:zinc/iron-chelating domain-containing protein [Sporanaerobium hydrogeniformans]|uniref:Zinc/iron-chelating domain-containing protein n=1 Tax=Sporanaerobium hydrogeniformans TaxID=3072179 RepID=A0AC61DF68_9FIRM|nr:YkgJ family cysteine cluster protein [Sporanaerobium hydrogeniformans]PHV71703.1 zinc/iron-chelating domain-containing protein [Sporanaerobium hydrogeniformans]
MKCRENCGACCIAPSITTPIPGMPQGKKAGQRCVQLDEFNRCKIFGSPSRPEVCGRLKPHEEMCGHSQEEAMAYLEHLEKLTMPTERGEK